MNPIRDFMSVSKELEDICSVGKYSYADGGSPNIIIYKVHGKLSIGNFVSIGPHCNIFLGSEHKTEYISTFPFSHMFNDVSYIETTKTKGDVIIGSDVWIGGFVTILSGVNIGHGAVIGAGSVVSKNVEPYSIVAGNPIKEIRKRFTEEQIKKLLKIRWWEYPDKEIDKFVVLLMGSDVEKFIKHMEGL